MIRSFVLGPLFAAAIFGPDLQIGQPAAEFWLTHGEIYNLPFMDKDGNLKLQQTKFFVANSALIPSHVRTGKGESLPHVHFRDDYMDIDAGNRYWDAKFDCPRMTKRTANATVRINCPAYILGKMGQGKFNYWLDDNLDSVQHAFKSDTGIGPKPSNEQQQLPAAAPPSSVHKLSWKSGISGLYQAKQAAYDPTTLDFGNAVEQPRK